MCYDVASQLRSQLKYARSRGESEEEIRKLELQLQEYEGWEPQYRVDGFSPDRSKLIVVTNEKPDEFQFYNWKFISDSVLKSKKFLNTLNCRDDKMFESYTYKWAARERHCIVYVDGFYEPHGYGKDVTKNGKKDKAKRAYYYLEHKADEPLALAGLWNDHVDKETGEITKTCTIITTEPSPLLRKIHNIAQRMPAILPKELQRQWLECVTEDDDPIQKQRSREMLKPYDDDLLKYTTVYNIKKRDAFGNTEKTLEEYDYTTDPEFVPIEEIEG